MIYDLSLKTAGLLSGAILLVLGVIGFLKAEAVSRFLQDFPRSRVAGAVLLTIDLAWTVWLLFTMEMGEFTGFRKPLLIILPIAFLLVLRFVDEFLAVRALGILLLLAAEPLLEAAFFRYESSRLLVTVLAYIIIVLGLLWVMMPYMLRDQIKWLTSSTARWKALNGIALVYGGAILGLAVVGY